MRILVTGGAGYIGSVLVPMLLQKDGIKKVVVIDNFMYGQAPLLDCIHDNRLTIKNEPFSPLSYDFNEFDAVVHLACITGAPACDKNYALAWQTNLGLVKNLIEVLPSHVKLVFPCTNSGYGIGQDSIECDEETPLKPVSTYGQLKVSAEKDVLDWGGVSLRFATLFGVSPRMRLDLLVNDFVFRALNDKFLVLFESHFKRNYLHVRDGARSIIHALDNYQLMHGQPYNVGLSSANLSKLDLARRIKEFLPQTSIITSEVAKDVDQRNYIVSNKKIEFTGFQTKYDLDDGIKELIRGFQIIKKNQYTNV